MKRSIFLFVIQMLCLGTIVWGQDQSDVDKDWRWIIPLETIKVEIENKFGESITREKDHPFQTYVTVFGKINIAYAKEKQFVKECSCTVKADTVLDYYVSPAKRFKLSDLKLDLSKFKKDDTYSPRELSYFNEKEGILIATEIVKLDDGTSQERVFALEYRPTGASCSATRCKTK